MSELTEIKQVPYKCDKCGHNDVVEAVIKRKPQTVVMEELQPITSKKEIEDMFDKKMKELKPIEAPKPAEKPKVVAPSYQPKHLCKGKDCEGHKNDNYSTRVKKKCTNCDQFAPEQVKKCPWCNNDDFDDVDDDELDSLGIPRPEEHSHSHDE